MAIVGRVWETTDILFSEFANKKRKEIGNPSLREMAKHTGIKYSRFRDILNQSHGTPTLQEFIAICTYFGEQPYFILNNLMRQPSRQTRNTMTTDTNHNER